MCMKIPLMKSLPDFIRNLVLRAMFFALRWETEFTPCTGITAVVRQERKAFSKQGIIIAPWHSRMKEAKTALASATVKSCGDVFTVEVAMGITARVQVFVALQNECQPVIFLGVEGFFRGVEHPYDTTGLGADAIVFAQVVDEFLRLAGARPHQWIWGADWETCPALRLLKSKHHTALHIHNIVDASIGTEAPHFRFPVADNFLRESVLQVALRDVDVAATVNRGFTWSLRNELVYTRHYARHLQHLLDRIVPVENGTFVPLTPELHNLAEELTANITRGRKTLQRFKQAARNRLPEEIKRAAEDKALITLMGRRVAQKLHEVGIASARALLRQDPAFPAFWFFATVPGDQTSSRRLDEIASFCAEFPENAAYSDGRLPYFSDLFSSADFNFMSSITEPHGGCFQAAVVPIVRAIDGLAAQVCGFQPTGRAAFLNQMWHGSRAPAGWSVREDAAASDDVTAEELWQLVDGHATNENPTFRRMTEAFANATRHAVHIWRTQPDVFAEITREALHAQIGRSWEINYGGMFSHIAAANVRRPLF
jgi:hypothetical protein